jgi:hypothetical protein
MPEGVPLWLNPRILIFTLALGMLGLAGGLVWQARSMAPSPDGFSGPITHRAPTDGFARDSSDVPEPPDYEEKVQSGFTAGGELRQGEAKTDSFPLEGSVDAFIYVAHPAGDLELELTSPSGQVYGPGRPLSPHVHYEKSEEGLFGLFPGHTVYFGIDQAEAGMWKARVIAKATPDTMPKVPYLLGSLIARGGQGGIAVKNLTKDRTYHIGESAVLAATVRDGAEPLREAQVTGYVPLDPAHPTPVPLLDDGRAPDSTAGDGKYSGRTPKFTRAGNPFYSIRAQRPPSPGKTGFDHTVGGMLSVSRSRSHWTGRFRDAGRDTTRDGLFDELVVQAEIEVTDSCEVSGDAVLTDSSGAGHSARFFNLHLTPGRQAISFAFDGREMFEGGHGGPYTLSRIRLSEGDDQGRIALLDELRNAYRTKAYDRYAFQRDPHRILGIAGVHGLQQGPDGKFGVLAVDVDVELDREEHIQSDGWLEAPGASGIHASALAVYPPGRQKIRLVFPGGCVHELGGHGGYRLRGFILIGQWMNGPERDLDLPFIDVQQYAGPHQLRRPDGLILSECGTQGR